MKRWIFLALLGALSSYACEGERDRQPSGPSNRDAAGGVDSAGADVAVADAAGEDAAGEDAAGEDVEIADAGQDAGMEDAGNPITIPDPGNASNDWGFGVNDVCCATPDMAYPVGTVTQNSGYIQGNIAPSGDFFYVFRAGPALTTFTFTGFITLDILDLHDGDGLVFGPVIPAASTGQNTGTWNVTPNRVYVLHLHSQQTGFF